MARVPEEPMRTSEIGGALCAAEPMASAIFRAMSEDPNYSDEERQRFRSVHDSIGALLLEIASALPANPENGS